MAKKNLVKEINDVFLNKKPRCGVTAVPGEKQQIPDILPAHVLTT